MTRVSGKFWTENPMYHNLQNEREVRGDETYLKAILLGLFTRRSLITFRAFGLLKNRHLLHRKKAAKDTISAAFYII